jgi:hypothetical protein
MYNLKKLVMTGFFYLKEGIIDFDSWSKEMIREYGKAIQPEIKYIRKWSVAINKSCLGNDYDIRLNCWDFMGCEFAKFLEGEDSKLESGCCPVLLMNEYNGFNNGTYAGRACWLVLNTKCFNSLQRNYNEKFKSCIDCEFYKLVIEEEGLVSNIYNENGELFFLK